jgi:hypothetical protein
VLLLALTKRNAEKCAGAFEIKTPELKTQKDAL